MPSRFKSKRLDDPGTSGVKRGERFKLALKQAGAWIHQQRPVKAKRTPGSEIGREA